MATRRGVCMAGVDLASQKIVSVPLQASSGGDRRYVAVVPNGQCDKKSNECAFKLSILKRLDH